MTGETVEGQGKYMQSWKDKNLKILLRVRNIF